MVVKTPSNKVFVTWLKMLLVTRELSTCQSRKLPALLSFTSYKNYPSYFTTPISPYKPREGGREQKFGACIRMDDQIQSDRI